MTTCPMSGSSLDWFFDKPDLSNVDTQAETTPQPSALCLRRPSLPQSVWESHRDSIIDLYVTKNWPLTQVGEHMSTFYAFHATNQEYKRRLKKWGARKYGKHAEGNSEQVPLLDVSVNSSSGQATRTIHHGGCSHTYSAGFELDPISRTTVENRLQSNIPKTDAMSVIDLPHTSPSAEDHLQKDSTFHIGYAVPNTTIPSALFPAKAAPRDQTQLAFSQVDSGRKFLVLQWVSFARSLLRIVS